MKSEWVEQNLGDILQVIRNGVNCKQSREGYGDPISRIETIATGEFNFEKVGRAELSEPDRKKYRLQIGDILFSHINSPPHIGKSALLKSEDAIYHGVNLLLLRPKEHVDARFLQSYLSYLHQSEFWRSRCKQSVNQASVNQTDIKAIQMPVPPLEDQQQIVAVLDEAFEGLARARAHAESNLQNARELFESKRRALLTADSDAWTTKTLNEVCIVERGSSPRPIKNFVTDDEDGIHWVKIGDTKVGSKYVTGTKEKITKKGAEKSRAVYVGDFILTNSMTYGRPYIMGIDGYIHDGWFVLRLKDEIDSDFFFHLLSSTVVQDQFEQLAAGSVVKNISGDLVKKAVLSLPPVAVQTVIASELDSISGDIDRIEKAYRDKLQDLDDLRQSLLQKAFAGELT